MIIFYSLRYLNIYIYEIKIESAAGNYTFVWLKSVEKYQSKNKEKIINKLNLPEDSNLEYITKCVNKHLITI